MDKLNDKNHIKKINNRFDLILEASKRARKIQILNKEMILNTPQQHKCTVIALKEIEDSLSF